MKMNAYIIGVGMTRFGKHMDKGLKSLAALAINDALNDAGLDKGRIQAAWMGTAAAPYITGQLCISGQAVLRGMGIGRIPVINVENACATSSTAVQNAAAMVTAGQYDVVLAAGYEKLYHADKTKTFAVFDGCVDVEDHQGVLDYLLKSAEAAGVDADIENAGKTRSIFMDIYSTVARDCMNRTDATAEHFAMVSAKNSRHGAKNPRAQFQNEMTVAEILAAPVVADPITLPMCSPIGDGAAACIIVSEKVVRELGVKDAVKIEASSIFSGFDPVPGEDGLSAWACKQFYKEAGISPADFDVVELHDASSCAELQYYSDLGLCNEGDNVKLLVEGATEIGGRIPVNPSGGLNRKGHPIGATGCGQIFELVEQLRGRAGERQVEGARLALAENGGGFIGGEAAAMAMTILSK